MLPVAREPREADPIPLNPSWSDCSVRKERQVSDAGTAEVLLDSKLTRQVKSASTGSQSGAESSATQMV